MHAQLENHEANAAEQSLPAVPLYRPTLTPTQAAVTGRHKQFLQTIRASASRVPINDELEKARNELKEANERANTSAALVAEIKRRLDDQINVNEGLERKIAGLRTENRILQQTTGYNPTIVNIIDTVAQHYGTTREIIVSNQRYAKIMRPRHVAGYLASQLSGFSLTEIGRVFKRDHSSMVHARDKIESELATDAKLVADIATIRAALGAK